jgi:4-oxalocrotonate tautomerase
MPLVKINSVAGNLGADAAARKKTIAATISQVLADEMGVSPKDVWVVFEEVEAGEWFVGPDSVQEMRDRRR